MKGIFDPFLWRRSVGEVEVVGGESQKSMEVVG